MHAHDDGRNLPAALRKQCARAVADASGSANDHNDSSRSSRLPGTPGIRTGDDAMTKQQQPVVPHGADDPRYGTEPEETETAEGAVSGTVTFRVPTVVVLAALALMAAAILVALAQAWTGMVK